MTTEMYRSLGEAYVKENKLLVDLLVVCKDVLGNLGTMENGQKCYTRNEEYSYAILENAILIAEGKR